MGARVQATRGTCTVSPPCIRRLCLRGVRLVLCRGGCFSRSQIANVYRPAICTNSLNGCLRPGDFGQLYIVPRVPSTHRYVRGALCLLGRDRYFSIWSNANVYRRVICTVRLTGVRIQATRGRCTVSSANTLSMRVRGVQCVLAVWNECTVPKKGERQNNFVRKSKWATAKRSYDNTDQTTYTKIALHD